MLKNTIQRNTALVGDNAVRSDVNQPWEQDNQAWWDWYVTLADNGERPLGDLCDVAPLSALDLPSDDAVATELHEPYRLTQGERERFRADGYIKLKGVLSAGAVLRLRRDLIRLLDAAFETTVDGGASERFLSLEMVWLENALVREYVLSPRIAKIAAELNPAANHIQREQQHNERNVLRHDRVFEDQ